jgi:hypothetical protein
MTDITEAERQLREALAAGPGNAQWRVKEPRTSDATGNLMYWVNGPETVGDYEDWGFTQSAADYIAACNPTNIAAILAELDRLRAERKETLNDVALMRRLVDQELVAEIETLLLENGALRLLTAIDAARKKEA